MKTQFEKELAKNGATLIDIRPYSDNNQDNHLSIVLCKRENQYEPFVTWYWNGSSNGFGGGHYFKHLSLANQDFKTR